MAVIVALVALSAPAVRAQDGGPTLAVASGARGVVAESVVRVRWSGLPAGTEEFELLLLLDDSAARTVRITERLDARDGSLAWVVPNLASASARLAIRLNRGRGEEPGPMSAPFRIVPRRSVPVQAVTYRAGEWWAAPGPVSSVGPPEAPARLRGGVRGALWTETALDAPPAGRGAVGDPRSQARLAVSDPGAGHDDAGRDGANRRPLSPPLRT